MSHKVKIFFSSLISAGIIATTLLAPVSAVLAEESLPSNEYTVVDVEGESSDLASSFDEAAVDPIAAFVTRFYQLCLSRQPDAAGLLNWTSKLTAHTATGSDVGYGFVFSSEFTSRNVSNDEYVRILYRAFFDREADPTGQAMWKGLLDGGCSRYYVLSGFTNSQEFQAFCDRYSIVRGTLAPGPTDILDRNPLIAQFVSRLYQQCLGRTPDTAGWIDWVTRLVNGSMTGANIANGLIFSQEFQSRGLNNNDYVATLYRALFGREADAAGLATWVGQLNEGRQRVYILDGFLRSQEYINMAASYKITPGTLNLPNDYFTNYKNQFAKDVLALVNAERAKVGVAPLTWNTTLEGYAKIRAYEITILWSHTRPDGQPWYSVGPEVFGENIAKGHSTPEIVVTGWMASSGHRENILRSNFTTMAVSCFEWNGRLYWAQLFG